MAANSLNQGLGHAAGVHSKAASDRFGPPRKPRCLTDSMHGASTSQICVLRNEISDRLDRHPAHPLACTLCACGGITGGKKDSTLLIPSLMRHGIAESNERSRMEIRRRQACAGRAVIWQVQTAPAVQQDGSRGTEEGRGPPPEVPISTWS